MKPLLYYGDVFRDDIETLLVGLACKNDAGAISAVLKIGNFPNIVSSSVLVTMVWDLTATRNSENAAPPHRRRP